MATPQALAQSSEVQGWLEQIEQAKKDMEEWSKACRAIRRRYRYENSRQSKRRRFQLLWSNQEIMKASVYARRPDPVVTSRWKDGDPVVRIATELLERNLDFQFDVNDFNSEFEALRDDFLLYARGVPRLRYEPKFKLVETDDQGESAGAGGLSGEASEAPDAGGESGLSGGAGAGEEVLDFENVKLDFVQRSDFVHPRARVWKEVGWVAYISYMDRPSLKKRFGDDLGTAIELDADDENDDERTTRSARGQTAKIKKATIYEIWDKESRQVLWIAKAYPDVLEKDDPYLKLEGFFPSPRPAYGTLSTDSLEPRPDFIFYQDQAEEIDDLTARIAGLSDSLKIVGFYPAGPRGEGSPEIEGAVRPGFENKMIAVASWDMFLSQGKGQAPIVFLPVEQVAAVLKGCVELRKQLLDDVYQITGISDIIRGDTEAEETAAAQGLKSQWGSFRLRSKQKEIARLARDVTRMAAEIMAAHFQVSGMCKTANLKIPTQADVDAANQKFEADLAQWKQAAAQRTAMMGHNGGPPMEAAGAAQPGLPGGAPPAGGSNGGLTPPSPAPLPPPPQPPDLGPTQEMVEGLLRDGVSQRFLIDIETDSTIAADEQVEQRNRAQFLEAVSKFVVAWMPIIQASPELLPVAAKMLLFAVRAFPVGRELEEVIEQAMDKLQAAAGQPKPPSPEQLKAQADMEKAKGEIERAKIDAQAAMQKSQADIEAIKMKSQAEVQTAKIKTQAEIQTAKIKADQATHEHNLKMTQLQMEHRLEQNKASMQANLAMQSAGAQHQVEQLKQQGTQKTLAQQMQIDETKHTAQMGMEQFKASEAEKAAKRQLELAAKSEKSA